MMIVAWVKARATMHLLPFKISQMMPQALWWLAARPDISSGDIGIIGHSEGGYIAPEAARDAPVAFMVLLADPTKPILPDVMTTQYTEILTSMGADAATILQTRRHVAKLMEILQGSGSVADKRAFFDAYLIQEDTKNQSEKYCWIFGRAHGVFPLPPTIRAQLT